MSAALQGGAHLKGALRVRQLLRVEALKKGACDVREEAILCADKGLLPTGAAAQQHGIDRVQ